jgi:ribosome-associated protein
VRVEIEDLRPWLDERFDRASGPGGQHVNKTSTRVTLLFDFQSCDVLSAAQRGRIARRLENRMDADGKLRVVAQQERSQSANRQAAEQRLVELLATALHVPKTRRPTKPTRSSQRRRVKEKRERGETKRLRGKRPTRDE